MKEIKIGDKLYIKAKSLQGWGISSYQNIPNSSHISLGSGKNVKNIIESCSPEKYMEIKYIGKNVFEETSTKEKFLFPASYLISYSPLTKEVENMKLCDSKEKHGLFRTDFGYKSYCHSCKIELKDPSKEDYISNLEEISGNIFFNLLGIAENEMFIKGDVSLQNYFDKEYIANLINELRKAGRIDSELVYEQLKEEIKQIKNNPKSLLSESDEEELKFAGTYRI